ncbi:MAG TPA: aspartate aminotransferase family protein, partial [Rhodobacteraceae bacterium]|nr:aspartate aminotransferase family protein [Paracoccaceae bacterium]
RQKIVIFKGAYHGSFDGVLATGWIDDDGTPQTAPMTDGTLQGMVEPAIVLEYGDMAGLDVIERHADDIALVLVEPVQSRNPENR